MAGPKVVMAGESALAATPDAIRANGCIIRATCSCGYQASLSCYKLADRGLGRTPIGRFAARLACPRRCTGSPSIEVVDPYRSALDPD